MSNKNSFLNLTVTLFLVTLISSASLAYVYEITKTPIEKASLDKKIKAIQDVTPKFTNNPLEEKYVIKSDKGDLSCYPAKDNGNLVATAIETFTSKGFAGDIKVMIGLLPDGTIYDTAILEQKETPGLGDKLDPIKSNFIKQFKGKNLENFKLSVKKDGGDVDAITAATISSRAFCDAVKRAYLAYKEVK